MSKVPIRIFWHSNDGVKCNRSGLLVHGRVCDMWGQLTKQPVDYYIDETKVDVGLFDVQVPTTLHNKED